MNAIKFIKEIGVEKAREVVEGAPEGSTHFVRSTYLKLIGAVWWNAWLPEWSHKDNCMVKKWKGESIDLMKTWGEVYKLEDLKRLVESVDLVKRYGGIAEVKTLHQDEFWSERVFERLKQAIADYELIYSDKEMGDDSHGDYMNMTLEQLQQEHAELLLFNDELDRNCKAHKAKANKYQTKCWHIQTLLMNPVDKDMTLKAIKTVIERVGEF